MKSLLGLVYGALCYLFFFVTFLYAIGFIGGIFVPKDINTGEETSMLVACLINVALLSVFALQHSIMARPFFKNWFTKIIPASIERSTYVLLSSLALALIMWQWRPLTEIIWSVESPVVTGIITAFFWLGWAIVFSSTFLINHFHLFGLKQVYDNLKGKEDEEPVFTVNFLYAIVRHPLMLGFMISFWAATTMTVGHLLFAVVCTAYIYIAVKYLEEKDLKKSIGKPYEEYQKQVPMLLPIPGKRYKEMDNKYAPEIAK